LLTDRQTTYNIFAPELIDTRVSICVFYRLLRRMFISGILSQYANDSVSQWTPPLIHAYHYVLCLILLANRPKYVYVY